MNQSLSHLGSNKGLVALVGVLINNTLQAFASASDAPDGAHFSSFVSTLSLQYFLLSFFKKNTRKL